MVSPGLVVVRVMNVIEKETDVIATKQIRKTRIRCNRDEYQPDWNN
jgi:hypothetical protein